MENRNILGLDLGTNSIGWAVINEKCVEGCEQPLKSLIGAGSRIIPMDASILGDFDRGNSISQTGERTRLRGVRRLIERCKLRRERLNRVLMTLDFLPPHYRQYLDRYGKFTPNIECRLPWFKDNAGNYTFLFQESYNEMIALFYEQHSSLMKNGLKIPYDWTLYYLRKKALTQKLSNYELAWVLHSFNQKRGYYQTRSENQEEDNSKKQEYLSIKVTEVKKTDRKKGNDYWYDIVLEDGKVYKRVFKEEPNWLGKTKEFILTTELDSNGNPKLDKEGNIKYSFRSPSEDDWSLIKIKTQQDIKNSNLTIGEYIFESILSNPKQKIRGKLVSTIDRDFYKDELSKILETQCKLNPTLQDEKLYKECIQVLYQQNDTYRDSIEGRDFKYLFIDNLIFYQRPLKSKKSLISNCPYESRHYTNSNNTTTKKDVKCIAKSHPLFQEFRLWQFIYNLKIYGTTRDNDGRLHDDIDVTDKFLSTEDAKVALFEKLNNLKKITQEQLLKLLGIKKPKDSEPSYRWNYVQDKEYPCNETRGEILDRLKKANIDSNFLNTIIDNETGETNEIRLWNILYGISDCIELNKAIRKFALKNNLDEKFIEVMSKFPPFKLDYGAYSLKAIKKLLPLMRMGKYWSKEKIDPHTANRINNIITGEYDSSIKDRVRDKAISLKDIYDFRGLPLWLACYIVYDRHSEAKDTSKWSSPKDIETYLKDFKQHSLHNPIVEQVITETLRVVKDIWVKYEHIDEIHVEMGREMKNPADKRKELSKRNLENENTNLRIKALLLEFLNPEFKIEDVRPNSPSQQEILKIYEGTVLESEEEIDDEIQDIIKRFAETDSNKRPTSKEILKYKLWLEQRYKSPYTGQPIALTRLFTSDYEIEHIIPQSRYFDDSYLNKVICEAKVNKLKGNLLGLEFIKAHSGEEVTLSCGKKVNIFNVDSYYKHVEDVYAKITPKKKKLLMEDIPLEFIERQLNDSRYISKLVKSLLSNIVREENEEEATSKNVIVCNGAITDRLKQDWGVNNVWNKIILPRFKRMNELKQSNNFTSINKQGHIIPAMPIELQKGFNKKRIDHRHHAMDAIVIACATRDHVNLLNNESAKPENQANRYQLSRKLRRYEDAIIIKNGTSKTIQVAKEFKMPWPSFVSDVENTLQNIIVSFKQNLRVINKTTNYTQRLEDGKKRLAKQTKGDSWAIRKPMHKDTVFGEVNLIKQKEVSLSIALNNPERIVNKELKDKVLELLEAKYNNKQIIDYFKENVEIWNDIDIKKIKVNYFTKETTDRYFATRKPIDDSFTKEKIENEITDSAIQKIMLEHLKRHNNNAKTAFSPDGIEEMNNNIVNLNSGKHHQPIYKVRWYEKANKFAVGESGNKNKKFVEGAKGTNLFFVISEIDKENKATGEVEKKRTFRSIPFNEAMQKMKSGENIDSNAKYILSPNDLVYIPTQEEINKGEISYPISRDRIYKTISPNKSQCFFTPYYIASSIQDKFEFSAQNKMERALTGEMIKDICIPIKIDRLGNIIKIG